MSISPKGGLKVIVDMGLGLGRWLERSGGESLKGGGRKGVPWLLQPPPLGLVCNFKILLYIATILNFKI